MQETLFNKSWVFNGSDISGIRFGSSLRLEHESIRGIRESFGINKPDGLAGIEARRIKTFPDHLHFFKEENIFAVGLCRYKPHLERLIPEAKKRLEWVGRKKDVDDFVAYWDPDSFIFVTNNSDLFLKIKEAFGDRDISVELSDGLLLRIISKTETSVKEEMMQSDLDSIRLNEAAVKTGIEESLLKAGREFTVLVPRWADDTKSSLVFWVNPIDQGKYKRGTYTLDELKMWVEDKGPIINLESKEMVI